MTKGISYNEAKRLIIKANFNKIMKEIEDVKLEYLINEQIDKVV